MPAGPASPATLALPLPLLPSCTGGSLPPCLMRCSGGSTLTELPLTAAAALLHGGVPATLWLLPVSRCAVHSWAARQPCHRCI